MLRKYEVNDRFFEIINTEEKAYLLGFFLADGTYTLGARCTNSYRFSIGLKSEDIRILEYYKENIVPTANIKIKPAYTSSNGTSHKESCSIRWTSSEMAIDMINYNITPRKTYDVNFEFPFNKLNSDCTWDFIRGFFDGDGQISYSTTTHRTTLALYGTSYNFMNSLGEIFEKEFNVEKRVEGIQKSNMILYTLRFKTKNYNKLDFYEKLYYKFYKDKKLFMKRKHDNLLNYLLFKYRDKSEDCERLQNIVEHSK